VGSIPTASTITPSTRFNYVHTRYIINLTFPIDKSTLAVMAPLATEVGDEPLASAFTAFVEDVSAPEITGHGGYDFCPRGALVLKSGQLTVHLSACSGVT
jgi:hypothetical protein